LVPPVADTSLVVVGVVNRVFGCVIHYMASICKPMPFNTIIEVSPCLAIGELALINTTELFQCLFWTLGTKQVTHRVE